VLDCRYP